MTGGFGTATSTRCTPNRLPQATLSSSRENEHAASETLPVRYATHYTSPASPPTPSPPYSIRIGEYLVPKLPTWECTPSRSSASFHCDSTPANNRITLTPKAVHNSKTEVPSMIETENLTKRFGAKTAVNALNLSIGASFSRLARNPWNAPDPSAPGEK